MAKQTVNQLDLIKQLLHDDYLEKGGDAKILREKGVMERNIIGHRGIDYLLYRYDPDKINLFPYFAQTSGLRKICDYFLFALEGQHLHILLIELKLGTESALQQLIASEYLVKFILDSAKRIGLELTEYIYIKKVRISEERAKQRNRKTKPSSIEYDVNKILNYDHSRDFRLKECLDV
jgi:hypothetical protein